MTRTHGLPTLLPLLCLGLAGCASVTGARTNLVQKPRTSVFSGDTPVAVRDRADRGNAAPDADDPEPPSRPDGRISGKVVDEQGQAVAGVEVRLADGGARSGSVKSVITDAGGGFTLRNLRPNGSYTLIAEGEKGETGRSDEAEPGTRVTIRLGEGDDRSTATAEVPEPVAPSRKVSRVSERNSEDDAEPREQVSARPRRPRRAADDDLPPAAEAEMVSNASSSKPSWRKGATTDPAVAPVDAEGSNAPRPSPIFKAPAAEPERPSPMPLPDEGPNPLPPAKERPATPEPPATPIPPSPSPDLPVNGENPAASEPPANPFASGAISPAPIEPDPDLHVETEPRKQATWGEITAKETSSRPAVASSTPLSVRRLTDAEAEGKAAPAPPQNRPRSGLIGRFLQGGEPDSKSANPISCQYDSKTQRILDFQYPDLDGNPVRFRDLDADFVLIDFWGTWCDPCMKSIPHLVELQQQYGMKTLRVVGIAAERNPNVEQKTKLVREVTEKLGVNYPILMSKADGSCPLQEVLHIQAYPTMVLVDRTGKILWRDTGSQANTLNRLDKVIATRVDTGIVRR